MSKQAPEKNERTELLIAQGYVEVTKGQWKAPDGRMLGRVDAIKELVYGDTSLPNCSELNPYKGVLARRGKQSLSSKKPSLAELEGDFEADDDAESYE